MQFEEMMVWLITAMGFTAVAFLFWTLAAVVRTSRSAGLAIGDQRAHSFGGPAPGDGHSS
jgi:hypothetical protein